MGVDPQKAWGLFASDPADFLVMFAIVILAVAWFVWWFRGYLVKERIETNEQRLALAREEQAAVTKQIEVLKPQLEEARSQLSKATTALVEIKSKPAALSNAIAQLKKAEGNSTLASTTVGTLLEANNALGATLTIENLNLTGSRGTPLALKEWAKSKEKG
jgi:chromosome segregation ATPase